MSRLRRSGAQVNPLAPRPAPRPLALAVVIAVVRKPSGGMPPLCRQVMADSELACVHAYLAPIPGPAPLNSIELFDPQGSRSALIRISNRRR